MPATLTQTSITIRRQALLAALQRVGRVTDQRTAKPVLRCVRLEATDGELRLSTTNLEIALTTFAEVDGDLPACLAPCDELTRRIKASKADWCTLEFHPEDQKLVLNGGAVEHSILTMDLAEFPTVLDCSTGTALTLDGSAFRGALSIAQVATARETSRYAINGMLLESDEQGARLVATDGRRMAIADLSPIENAFRDKVILPKQFALLITKLIDRKHEGHIVVTVGEQVEQDGEKQPRDLFVAGKEWLLSSKEHDGDFPHYRDVVPASASRFVVDRQNLLDTLDEVALATNEEARGIQVDLGPKATRLSAEAPGMGESSGSLFSTFEGGGDHRIITCFNPNFLKDALKTLSGEKVVIDLNQNKPDLATHSICGMPALIYSAHSQAVRWVLMPISTGLAPSPEMLGSNYQGDLPSPQPATTPADASPGNDDGTKECASKRRRKRVARVWPDVGCTMEATYRGQAYTALVIVAPKLKSGRAIQVTSGPATGQTFGSMSAAMEAATAKQRRKLGLGKGKRGLPSSGWDFWQVRPLQRASA